MCEKKEKPSVSEDFRQKKFYRSDVEKFHQWRNLRKKFCFGFEFLARAAVKLGRIFLLKQIRASRTANLTEYIYLLND